MDPRCHQPGNYTCACISVWYKQLYHCTYPTHSQWCVMCHWELHSLWPTLAPCLALITPLLSWSRQCKSVSLCVWEEEKNRNTGEWNRERYFPTLRRTLSLFQWQHPHFSYTNGCQCRSACIRGWGESPITAALSLSFITQFVCTLIRGLALPAHPSTLRHTHTHVCSPNVSTLIATPLYCMLPWQHTFPCLMKNDEIHVTVVFQIISHKSPTV